MKPKRSTLVITLLVAAGLITAKTLLEDKFRYFEDKAYELMQWRLISRGTTTRPDVLVIDTAQVPHKPWTHGRSLTSRVKLREVIKSLTDLQARSIGIDVDFSPENGQFIDADDPKFFQFCLDHSSATHVPIFLGVYRTEIDSAPYWLGDDRFLHLAAFIGIKKTDRAVYWKMSGTDFPLRGLGAAVAGKQLKEMIAEENSLLSLFIRQTSIIQFRWLQRIREDVFHSINREYLDAEKEKIAGRMILLGDANEESCGADPALWNYKDCFSVIGIPYPVKGVFLHACAASTIADNEPLFEFTSIGRICADVILALLTIGAVELVGVLRKREKLNSEHPEWKLNMIFTFMMILLVLFVSIGLVGFTGLLWVDLILVCVVMLLQLIVDTRSEWSKHLLPRSNQKKNPPH